MLETVTKIQQHHSRLIGTLNHKFDALLRTCVEIACSKQSRISSGLLTGRKTAEQHGENLPLTGRKESPAEKGTTLPLQTTGT
jgi:hypothetical protein